MRIYKGDKYTLEYPVEWQTTNENGILNFFPIENFGALTLSKHSDIDFPLENTKQVILDMYEIKDKPENVKMLRKGDIYEFTYQHVDKDVKWVTKAFRNKTDFYLLTVNCELSKWDTNKDMFFKVINTFKIN